MMQLMAGGTTVFFVSHSVEQIREMCNKVLWMEHGRMVGFGDSDKICNIYERC